MPIYVKDLMTSPVNTIDLEKTVAEAGKLMKKYGRGSLIVTKKKDPVGIITADDIIRKVVANNIRPGSIKVKDVMSSPLITITPDSTCVDAARKMRRNSIKRLPVIQNGKLVGIISLNDIATTIPEFTQYLEERLESQKEELEIKEESTSGICDSCGDFSEDLRNIDDKWLCETCRDEVEK